MLKGKKRTLRRKRIRSKIEGTSERPRLSIYCSNSGVYAQIIDDEKQKTLVSASSIEKSVKGKNKTEISKKVGENIGQRALKAKIKSVVFDRGAKPYHGRVAAVAESARKAGLKF